jgi:hypothetical protein
LYLEIRAYLLKASDQKLICEKQPFIMKELRFSNLADGFSTIAVGNERNFRRDPQLPHFTRPDGSWFDFQLLLSEKDCGLEIVAYDFELRVVNVPQIEFVRLDLNPPDGRPSGALLRSHLHLSSDDDGLSVPAPVLSPFEALDLFLHGVRNVGRVRRLGQATT